MELSVDPKLSNLLSSNIGLVDSVLTCLNYRELLNVSSVNRFWQSRIRRIAELRQGQCIPFYVSCTEHDTGEQQNACLTDRTQVTQCLRGLDWPAGLLLCALSHGTDKRTTGKTGLPDLHSFLPPSIQTFGASCSGIIGTEHESGLVKQRKDVSQECVSGLLISQALTKEMGVQIVKWTSDIYEREILDKSLNREQLLGALDLPASCKVRGVVLLTANEEVSEEGENELLDCVKQVHLHQQALHMDPPLALLGGISQSVLCRRSQTCPSQALVLTGERVRAVSCVLKLSSNSVDLRERFSALVAELKSQNCNRVLFGLSAMCFARSTQSDTEEIQAFRHVLPDVPLLGLFVSGEYGWDTQATPTQPMLDNAHMEYDDLMLHQLSGVWMLVALTDP